MAKFELTVRGLEELRRAVLRNPQTVLTEVGKFLVRGIAVYNRIIIRNPWRRGMSGGGAPKDTGNLRDTHVREIQPWSGRIYPTAPYAPYVHGIEGFRRRRTYQLRPWLDHAKQTGDREIQQLQGQLLDGIIGDLAR
ncbi:MAG: hypothetical protein RLO51_11150 [Thalassobaculum sp.]|uniref:hypothetical protein n=1 Tax=Thalassobaculum sp. TaxID=2022740 RepID=UPI0032ECC62A